MPYDAPVVAEVPTVAHALSRDALDEIFGGLSSLLAIGIGIVGFILGIMGSGFANEWLFAGVIAGLAAVAFMFDGERRAAAAAARVPAEGSETGEQFRNRFVS